jgi:hypothetical protein
MEAPGIPARPRAVSILGWIWLVAAALQCVEGLIGLAVWKFAGLEEGLPALGIRAENVQVQLAHLGGVLRYALPVILARIVLAAAAAWAAFELLRLKPRGRRAILAISTLGIVLAIGVGVFVYLTTARVSGLEGAEKDEVLLAGAAVGAFVALLFSSFFGTTIYVLNRPAVRTAFGDAA